MASEYLHAILSLSFVLIFMVGLLMVFKKFKSRSFFQNQMIKILNSVPVGVKEKLMLVEVNNTFLLLGVTPSHIETLHIFSELAPLADLENPSDKSSSFIEKLKSTIAQQRTLP